jgi:hypothetical protein
LTGSVLVSSNHGRVDHDPVEVRFLEPFKNGSPASLLRPIVEAMIDSVVFAEAFRQVRPGRTGASDPNHRVNKPTVIFGISTGGSRLSGKQRFDPLILLIRNFVASSHRRKEFGPIGARSPVDADQCAKMLLL